MAALLGVSGVSRAFGGVYAVIGPNGAGKSTLFRMIGGQLAASSGMIRYDGARIDRLAAYRRARLGIAIVFQEARIFRGMSAIENVMVGAHAITRVGSLGAVLRMPAHGREERDIRRRAGQALSRVGLSDWAHRPADALPLGQQRAVQMARALCGQPRLLLLDEPASGLRAAERAALAELIEQLRTDGLTMMLIEHDVAFVARLADRITVLDLGRVIARGDFPAIRLDPKVIAAYLGNEEAP